MLEDDVDADMRRSQGARGRSWTVRSVQAGQQNCVAVEKLQNFGARSICLPGGGCRRRGVQECELRGSEGILLAHATTQGGT